jgi:tetratricopeptide (TPR) repeat protein
MTRALLVAMLFIVPSIASAQTRPGSRSEFWESIREPARQRARTLQRHGLQRLEESEEAYGMHRRAVLVEGGITRLRLASQAAPDEPAILLSLAIALERHDEQLRDGTLRPRTEEAIEVFEALRALDPAYEAATVAFELGILRTKQRDFPASAVEYQRALDLALSEEETITVHGNLAEVSMLAGDLDVAIDHFEQCVDIARAAGNVGERSIMLCLFGLAVALDRGGEPAAALQRAREAVSLSGGTTSVLRSEGVFFEPSYEIHHYEGLGQLALAELESNPIERRARLAGARISFTRYLDEGGRRGLFADAAVRRVAELDTALAPPSPAPRRRVQTR